MKAIETVYNGYRFRSRLEARWAVFFDALGIEYQYELEGFELGNGIKYLPDFRVKSNFFTGWIEIKPQFPNEIEIEKAIQLSMSGDPVIIFIGEPYLELVTIKDVNKAYGITAIDGHLICDKEVPSADYLFWGIMEEKIAPYSLLSTVRNMQLSISELISDIAIVELAGEKLRKAITHPKVLRAYKIARQARFEHGESG